MSDPFSPYTELYKNPQGPGDKRPTALTIIEDNNLIQSWSNKVVLITGGTSGIGVETARALYATGAKVFITARDLKKADATVREIVESTTGQGTIEVIEMDMDSLESVKKAAQSFLIKSQQLNVLVNNAGIMACPKSLTKDGFERQFGVNHLAHFALTNLLLPTLIVSSSDTFNSRVVFVSSSSHRYSPVRFDDIGFAREEYNPFVAYGQSKAAMNWTANYIDRVYGARGVHASSLNPGGIWTGLQSYATPEQLAEWKKDQKTMQQMQSPAQGAATTVWAAAGNVWEGRGGKYLADVKLAKLSTADKWEPIDDGYAPWNYSPADEDRLWKLSLQMTGVEAP